MSITIQIRKMAPEDIKAVGDVWLTTSIDAHDFVPARYWRADLETMVADILPDPNTEAYVHEGEGAIDGFLSMGGDKIGYLYVLPGKQRAGVGSCLLNRAKEGHSELHLTVFKVNKAAAAFYASQGFRFVGESVCQNTGCEEFKMSWKRDPAA